MTATLGKWEIRTSPGKKCLIVRMSRNETSSEPNIEQTVADFITRNVLERDAVFFEG